MSAYTGSLSLKSGPATSAVEIYRPTTDTYPVGVRVFGASDLATSGQVIGVRAQALAGAGGSADIAWVSTGANTGYGMLGGSGVVVPGAVTWLGTKVGIGCPPDTVNALQITGSVASSEQVQASRFITTSGAFTVTGNPFQAVLLPGNLGTWLVVMRNTNSGSNVTALVSRNLFSNTTASAVSIVNLCYDRCNILSTILDVSNQADGAWLQLNAIPTDHNGDWIYTLTAIS